MTGRCWKQMSHCSDRLSINRTTGDGRVLSVADRSIATHSCHSTVLTPDVHEGRLPTCCHGLGARPPASSRLREDLNRARFYAMLLSPNIVRKIRACAGDQSCCPFLRRRHDGYVESVLLLAFANLGLFVTLSVMTTWTPQIVRNAFPGG